MNKSRVALVVGHSEVLQGASNSNFHLGDGIATEFRFNKQLAKKIATQNKKENIEFVIIYRDTDYEALPSEINTYDADLVISLHCNAYNGRTRGCETLYYKHTKISDKVAQVINDKLNEAMENPNRGIKPRDHDRKRKIYERGAYLMKYTKAPCVICEPFFIDNSEELEYAIYHKDKLALAYLRGIEKALEVIK